VSSNKTKGTEMSIKEKKKLKALEKGGAQINIRLIDGKMIVRHTNQEGVLLHERNCYDGEWDELWEFIRRSD